MNYLSFLFPETSTVKCVSQKKRIVIEYLKFRCSGCSDVFCLTTLTAKDVMLASEESVNTWARSHRLMSKPTCSNNHRLRTCRLTSQGRFKCPKWKRHKASQDTIKKSGFRMSTILLTLLCMQEKCTLKFMRRHIELSRYHVRKVTRWICQGAALFNEASYEEWKGDWGGLNKVIWDETVLDRKRKGVRGRRSTTWWAAGGVELGPNNKVLRGYVYSLPPGEGRSHKYLLGAIRHLVQLGSEVWTDQLSSYDILKQNYIHGTVNHGKYFINPRSGVLTNAVEGFWSCLKKTFRRSFQHNQGKDVIVAQKLQWASFFIQPWLKKEDPISKLLMFLSTGNTQ